MERTLLTIVSVWLAVCSSGMADDGVPNAKVARPLPAASEPFLTGVDANYAPMMIEQGAVWKVGSRAVDLLPELRRNGANAFRVRVWTGRDGPSGLTYATKLAAQAQRAGLKPYLVLFLSEDWSDLMKQPAPLAWRDLPFEEKLVQVKQYAQETARHFLAAGIKSDLYEIGNEIDFGLCGEFEESWANRVSTQYMGERIWPKEARVVRAAEDGVLAANPQARFMVHLARWWEPDYAIAFLQAMDRERVRVDDLGLTYYPSSGLGPANGLADLDRSVQRIEGWRRVPVIICEYAYPSQPSFAGMFSSWNKSVDGYPLTEAGQAQWIADFLAFCRKDADIRGAFHWSPEWSSPEMWTAFALFRPDGSAKPGLASLGPAAPTDPVVVTVDTRQAAVESFLGLGVEGDPYGYVPSPAAWKTTLRRLDFLRPAFLRVMFSAQAYCLGFAADGTPEYVWTQGEKTWRERLGMVIWILDYAQAHGIPVMLGEWAPPGKLGDGPGDTVGSPDDPRWARIIADFVHWLRVERGYSVVGMYNMMNEPNGDWMWPEGRVDYAAWAKGIHNLRHELDARGLADLPIVGPDNAWGWEWIDRVSGALPDCIGAWEMHWYATDKEVLDGRVEELLAQKRAVVIANDPAARSKPFFLGEAGMIDGKINGDQQPRVRTFAYGVFMADFVAQIARAGWQGAVAWDLDDAMHMANGYAVPPNDKTLKVWGFWNTQGKAMGHPEDENIRPWFATWSLMTRLFPHGARIVAATQPSLPGLRVLSAAPKDGKGLTVMVVNNSDEHRTVLVRVPGSGGKTIYEYRYFDGDRPTDAEGFPLPKGEASHVDLDKGVAVHMPGQGVVFLTTELVQ